MTPTVSIIVPTLRRAQGLIPFVDSIRRTSPLGEYRIVFVTDPDDDQTLGVIQTMVSGLDVDRIDKGGTFPVKVNAAVAATDTPLMLVCGDDTVFKPGWYDAMMAARGPGVIGTNDLTPRTKDKNHATAQVLEREYVDDPGAAWNEPGHAFHEGYHHNYADDELCRLAIYRGEFVFADDCVIEHHHPIWGTKEWDDVYAIGERNAKRDRALYSERRRAWVIGTRRKMRSR
jgi:glycosyltransferase involved in cell wall biosynthesis